MGHDLDDDELKATRKRLQNNEIKVGEYVRTKDGFIRKVDKIDKCLICKEREYINKEIISGLHFENTYHKKDILKHSPNIIDLIEERRYS